MTDFLWILEKKYLSFCIFWYFRKSSAAQTKIAACVLSNVAMLQLEQLIF